MPGRDDSSWRAGGAGRWLAAQQVVWAVVAVGALALAAPGQQASDPAVARVLRELQAWEGDPVTIARALEDGRCRRGVADGGVHRQD
jgi:hypothetical protein